MENVIIYSSIWDFTDELSDEQTGKLFKGINQWRKGEEVIFDDLLLKGIWMGIKPTLENTKKNYYKKVEANQKNGKKGGRPKKQSNTSTKEILNEGGKIKSNEVKTISDNNIPQKKDNVLKEIKLTKQKQDDYSIEIAEGEVVKLNENDYNLIMGDDKLEKKVRQSNNQQGVEYWLKLHKNRK